VDCRARDDDDDDDDDVNNNNNNNNNNCSVLMSEFVQVPTVSGFLYNFNLYVVSSRD
jgi:hypothetical protein